MRPTPHITEAVVRRLADSTIFQRGQAYYAQGAVLRLVQRGNVLRADVEGSDEEPYRVQVIFDKQGIDTTDCTCPYGEEWGGACKHTIAALLAFIREPNQAEERAPIEELLQELDAVQLRSVLQRLVELQPALADVLEAEVSKLPSPRSPLPAGSQLPPPNVKAIRKQVRATLHALDSMRPSEAYWHVGGVVRESEALLSEVDRYLEAGDVRGALQVLEAVTQEYVDGYETLDDSDGEVSGFFATLGSYWTRALLSPELSRAEREHWAELLTDWQDDVGDYGIEGFEAAIEAAEQGWDDRRLQRVLAGELDTLWSGERPWHADVLTTARLESLERQGRTQEYLNLAKAEGQTVAYATMLVKLGRVEEAGEYGLSQIETPADALKLARILSEYGATAAALLVAERGLTLEDRATGFQFPGAPQYYTTYESPQTNGKTLLARWLREHAEKQGQPELALKAALCAARSSADLNDYLAVQALADGAWPTLREELLGHYRTLAGYSYLSGKVDIYLHEQLWDDAIAVVDRHSSYGLAERVADAVIEHRPAWVKLVARRHAGDIMDQAKSSKYDEAIAWLRRDRDAARAAGTEAEWRSYIQELVAQHKRKYKLVPMLQSLLGR